MEGLGSEQAELDLVALVGFYGGADLAVGGAEGGENFQRGAMAHFSIRPAEYGLSAYSALRGLLL